MQAICRYLVDEAFDKFHEDWTEREFHFCVQPDIPQQSNGSDCGVFLVQYAKRLSSGQPVVFVQRDVCHFRVQMFQELHHDRIFD